VRFVYPCLNRLIRSSWLMDLAGGKTQRPAPGRGHRPPPDNGVRVGTRRSTTARHYLHTEKIPDLSDNAPSRVLGIDRPASRARQRRPRKTASHPEWLARGSRSPLWTARYHALKSALYRQLVGDTTGVGSGRGLPTGTGGTPRPSGAGLRIPGWAAESRPEHLDRMMLEVCRTLPLAFLVMMSVLFGLAALGPSTRMNSHDATVILCGDCH
jgi:hypothetical protein